MMGISDSINTVTESGEDIHVFGEFPEVEEIKFPAIIVEHTGSGFEEQFMGQGVTLGSTSDNKHHLIGKIDDLLIYNYSRTLKQIRDNYKYEYPFTYIKRISQGNITVESRPDWWGTEYKFIEATDVLGETNISNIALFNITPINDPPILVQTIPNMTWDEDRVFKNALNLSLYFTDIEEDTLTFSV